MTFLPIVNRELRVASRRSGTYWARFQAAAVAVVAVGFIFIGPVGFTAPSLQGPQVFSVLAFISLLSALMAAVRWTADCLSSEKREGTLGFLFLTDLKAYDVVAGKLASSSLSAAYGLLAVMPVLTIPMLLGGVTIWDVARLGLMLANTLFFAMSLALLVSAVNWDEKKAVGLTMLFLFGVFGLLPVMAHSVGSGFWAFCAGATSPGTALRFLQGDSYSARPDAFWISLGVTHLLGWLFFWTTCLVLPRLWQDLPTAGLWFRWREWCRRMLLGGTVSRTAFRRHGLGVNPVYWLASREQMTVWYPWILLVSVGLCITIFCWLLQEWRVEPGALLFVSFFANWFFKHWIANVACHAFSTDRDRGAMELLLSTSMDVRDMIRGHRLSLLRQFRWPVLLLLSVELVLWAWAFAASEPGWFQKNLVSSTLLFGNVLMFVIDVPAVVWVGWWAGVVSRNASSALSMTYLRVMILPWVVAASGAMFISLSSGLGPELAAGSSIVLWLATSIVADVYFARHAKEQLLTRLRTMAVERYAGGDASMIWWRRMGRWLGEMVRRR